MNMREKLLIQNLPFCLYKRTCPICLYDQSTNDLPIYRFVKALKSSLNKEQLQKVEGLLFPQKKRKSLKLCAPLLFISLGMLNFLKFSTSFFLRFRAITIFKKSNAGRQVACRNIAHCTIFKVHIVRFHCNLTLFFFNENDHTKGQKEKERQRQREIKIRYLI